MKYALTVLCLIPLVYSKTLGGYQNLRHPQQRCVNMWDEGCVNGQLPGAGNDNYYLGNNGFNPGKRCVNMWDEGCVNGQLGGAGSDSYYLADGFSRAASMCETKGCVNEQLGGAGSDSYYLQDGFNPGKRCVNMWDDGCVNGQLGGAGSDDFYLGGGGFNPGKRSLKSLLEKLHQAPAVYN